MTLRFNCFLFLVVASALSHLWAAPTDKGGQLRPLLLLTDDGPPHMIKASKSGIDVDITKEVIESLGYQVTIEFAPLQRNMRQVSNQQADMFVPTFYQNDSHNLFISDPIIEYRPTVFSLNKKRLNFKQLSDIKNLRVFTFQGAKGYFGDAFVKMAKQNYYREIHDMSKLPSILTAERADIVVLDYYIFYYFLNLHGNNNPANNSSISEHNLIPTVNAHVGFHDSSLRDAFNKQLDIYLTQKRDLQVINKYLAHQP